MEIDITKIDWNKSNGLIPAIIQNSKTLEVLMLGFMNEEALKLTLSSKKVTFWSRSRNKLWTKGETSGNFLILERLSLDCDNDTLLILANPKGPTCHKNTDSCFVGSKKTEIAFLESLQSLIKDRHLQMPEKSYTTTLFKEGLDRIAQKVGEEAVETVIASKNDDINIFANEASDLLFHLFVLLEAKGISIKEIANCLESRH